MSGRWSSAGTYYPHEAAYQQEATDAGYFVSLAPARYVQVTTFGRDGRPVPARAHGVVDGGRAYFAARSRSGTVRRLRHADAVQVAPCSVLGLCYGPPLEAAARLLSAEEAGRAAAEQAPKYPHLRRPLTSWLHRAWRPKMVHYELVADDATDGQDTYPPSRAAPGQRGDQSGSYAARGGLGSGQCQVLRTHVTDHGAGSIACIWPTPAHMRPRQP
jgi:PPOX class probable F420-dependent enzyme